MEFVDAIPKTLRDIRDEAISAQEQPVKAFQITEENASKIGSVVASQYYVIKDKLEMYMLPEEVYFNVTVGLYSDTDIVRAALGDWILIKTMKYKIEAEWLSADAFEERFEIPQVIEEPEKKEKDSQGRTEDEVEHGPQSV